MGALKIWLRDLRRCFSDADLAAAKTKFAGHDIYPGKALSLTRRELRALISADCIIARSIGGSRLVGMEFVFDLEKSRAWKRSRVAASAT